MREKLYKENASYGSSPCGIVLTFAGFAFIDTLGLHVRQGYMCGSFIHPCHLHIRGVYTFAAYSRLLVSVYTYVVFTHSLGFHVRVVYRLVIVRCAYRAQIQVVCRVGYTFVAFTHL